MKKSLKLLSILLVICLVLAFVAACDNQEEPCTSHVDANSDGICDKCGAKVDTDVPSEPVDYVYQLKLDMNSSTKKQEVTVKNYVDGDTTHFNVPKSVSETGVLKARYLAINTPESTGKIEDYGHTASRFTKEKLKSAVSIIVESDDNKWNIDSTGSRFLVWVWYKPAADAEYRNLNLEILQEGLAIASNTANNRYGTICTKALDQAKKLKLYVFSGVADPEVYRGEAIEITLKELRTNIEDYKDKVVAFEGNSIRFYNNGVYLQDYDEETDMYYGIYCYYGFSFGGVSVLALGNRVRMVGSVQYYETGGTYQVTDIKYDPFDDSTLSVVSRCNPIGSKEIDAATFTDGKVRVEKEVLNEETGEVEVQVEDRDFAELAMNTLVEMKNLKIVGVSTTTNEDSSSYGAMTFTCQVDGKTVKVRTVPLYDDAGNLLTKEDFLGKTINVKGIVDFFGDDYQIKVFSVGNITVVE
ncbi:MAG TPA: hypothetical protein DEQ88_03820 [Clostridiales bacterium]|nr:hypothetical protein [Clostridiales bacterium]